MGSEPPFGMLFTAPILFGTGTGGVSPNVMNDWLSFGPGALELHVRWTSGAPARA